MDEEQRPMPQGPADMEQMKQQCIFCQIVDGRVASKKVYEDGKFIAILDINPANPGHVLIIPKEHHTIMPLMPSEDVQHMAMIAKKISRAQIRALGVGGTNMFVANGAPAGQKAPHFMMHLIPRKDGDGVTVFKLVTNQITPADQEKLRIAIKMQVNAQFGITDRIVETEQKPESQETEEPEDDEAGEEAGPEEAGPKKKFNLDRISDLFKKDGM